MKPDMSFKPVNPPALRYLGVLWYRMPGDALKSDAIKRANRIARASETDAIARPSDKENARWCVWVRSESLAINAWNPPAASLNNRSINRGA